MKRGKRKVRKKRLGLKSSNAAHFTELVIKLSGKTQGGA